MQIITLGISDVRPYEKNPRKITPRAINQVAESIKAFGFRVPIIIDKSKVVIAGHTRLLAAKSIGMESVPCIMAEDLTPAQVRAFRLADNKTAEAASWDDSLLASELDALFGEFDMLDFGFKGVDFKDPEAYDDGFNSDDSIERAERAPRVSRGQVYLCGRHRVMCGDSTDASDMAILMGGRKADLLLTDPPYNVDYTGRTQDALKIDNDNMDLDSFLQFLSDSFSASRAAMRDGAVFYIWHSERFRGVFLKACEQAGLDVREVLIWAKNNFSLGHSDYQYQHEPCLYGWTGNSGHYWCGARNKSTLISEKKPKTNDLHPTMKPVPLFSMMICNSPPPLLSRETSIVLDPFAGSGTTLVACEELGRAAYCMELDPAYCQVMLERWERLSGGTAELAHDQDA